MMALLVLLVFGTAPIVAVAQAAPAPAATAPRPTQAEVKAAMAAANPDFRQKRKLKPMVDTYKSQVANAPDEATKIAATQQLIASMKTVLTPDQQAAFKQSLLNQMSAAH